MTTETPLARLTELDARLVQFLNACPTLWSVLSANLASRLSPPANTLAPDAIYLDEQPLTHWLAQAIATPGSEPQGPVLYATAQGLIPLPPYDAQGVLRLARLFSRDARTRWLDSLHAFWNVDKHQGQLRLHWQTNWLFQQWQAQVALREQGRTLAGPPPCNCAMQWGPGSLPGRGCPGYGSRAAHGGLPARSCWQRPIRC